MKIVFTGGGSGGHFYPLIAVAEEIHAITRERDLVEPKLYYFGPTPFDEQALFANTIQPVKISTGKVRRYASALNVTDAFLTLGATISCIFKLFSLYPDVVFSTGSYVSVPVVLAAHLLRIPIVIQESDAKPGRANKLAAKYAYRIALAFENAVAFLPPKAKNNIAITGIPIRKGLSLPETQGAKQLLGLDTSVPTVLIIGGSLGSMRINQIVLEGLSDMVNSVNVIHQTGKDNFKEVETESSIILQNNPNKARYHVFPYLTADSLRQAAGAADLIISRAGSGSINEISYWKKPAILIPIPESISHDQRTNAYAYAHTGAAVVLEEENMTPHLLVSEVRRITSDAALSKSMSEKGSVFSNPAAARTIAEELIAIGLSHEPEKVTEAA